MQSLMSVRSRRSRRGCFFTGLARIALPAVIALPATAFAQNAAEAWLKYRSVGKPLTVPTRVDSLGQSLLEQTAAIELRRGLLSLSGGAPLEMGPNKILLGTVPQMQTAHPKSAVSSLQPDEFLIFARHGDLAREIDIIGGSDRGTLYGVFALLRNLAQGTDMSKANLRERPAMPIRWVD